TRISGPIGRPFLDAEGTAMIGVGQVGVPAVGRAEVKRKALLVAGGSRAAVPHATPRARFLADVAAGPGLGVGHLGSEGTGQCRAARLRRTRPRKVALPAPREEPTFEMDVAQTID